MSKFNERFRKLKDESELSSKELAKELGIAPSTLSYYLKDREPNYDMLIKIADYFDVTIDWLVGRNDSRSSVYTALDEEIANTIIKNEYKDISKDDITPLSIFKDDYFRTQEKFIELMSFFYTVLQKLEELQKLHPEFDYSYMNDSLIYNFIESVEYQIDILDTAQYAILNPTSKMFLEYYFNSLLKIDLISGSYKMVLANIIKIGNENFDGNNVQKSVISDFIKQLEKYGQHCISDIELSSYLNKIGI